MKKRLLITLLMVAVLSCLFAIAVSAAGQHYTTFDVVLSDGTQKTAYTPGTDQWQGRIYLTATLYAEAPLDSDGTYETIDWASVKVLDFSNSMIYLYDKNTNTHTEKAYGSNQGGTAMYVMRNGANGTTMSSVEKIITGKVVTIGGIVFSSMANLKEVVISPNTKELQYNSFEKCPSLTTVTFAENGNLTTIGQQSFINCTGLKSITLPNTITSMGNSVFQGCTSLESFSWPTSYTKIPSSTFNGCKSLKDFIIPDYITEIGSSAFNTCTSLTRVHIPASVTSIGSDCFRGASNITSVTFDPNCTVTKLYAHTFDGTAITEITIPNTVTAIGQNCFNCKQLVRVNLGASFVNFNASNAGQPPFACSSTLKYVYLPDTFVPESVRNCVFSWNDNNANEYNNIYIDLTFLFTGTKAQGQAIIDAANGVNTYISSMKLISAEDYATQVANGTLVTGVKGTPARYLVYGYNKCDAFYNGEHVLSENYELDFTDFTTSFNEVSVCTVCSKKNAVNEKDFAPIFVFAGYSVKENDPTALCTGYTVNHSSMAVYKKYNSTVVLEYGILAATPNSDNSALLKIENGKVVSTKTNAITVDINTEYAGFDFILRGFSTEEGGNNDMKLIICSYISDGNSILYMTDACSTSVPSTITMTEIKKRTQSV